MREIKFRAWDKIAKRMQTDIGIMAKSVGLWDGPEKKTVLWFSAEAFEIMQSTGLTDSKGVEIYEGDIVKEIGTIIGCGIVEYDAPAFIVRRDMTKSQPYVSWPSEFFVDGCEVIGNIHENPELLEAD